MPRGRDLFPSDHASASEAFIARAARAGARVESLPIAARGPSGESLAIRIAWLGKPAPARVLFHVSGIHGVEGFAGSAIQAALLEDPPPLGPDAALVLVHVLNPYGMAWLRRANEHNVDLNRNFILDGRFPESGSPGQAGLAALLNPVRARRFDFFLPRLLMQAVRHGRGAITEAIASGQYAFPEGLFFGDRGLEPGPAAYVGWLKARLGSVARGFVIDVHTGLVRWGGESLYYAPSRNGTVPAADATALARMLGRRVLADGGESVGYSVTGGHVNAYRALRGQFGMITQELGTYGPLRVLASLRTENAWHRHREGRPLVEPAPRRNVRAGRADVARPGHRTG